MPKIIEGIKQRWQERQALKRVENEAFKEEYAKRAFEAAKAKGKAKAIAAVKGEYAPRSFGGAIKAIGHAGRGGIAGGFSPNMSLFMPSTAKKRKRGNWSMW